MKKLFLAICFIGISLDAFPAFAAVQQVDNPIEAHKQQGRPKSKISLTAEDPNIPKTAKEFQKYLQERARTVVSTPMEFIENNSTMNVQNSSEYIAKQGDKNKSTFQKIYEEALSRLNLEETQPPKDIVSYTFAPQNAPNPQKAEKLGFDVISIELPNGEKVLAPAKEHIPYMISRIDILPNGMIKIQELVTVVANGEKLKNGLSKALPKYSTSRSGVRSRSIPYLESVKINNTEIAYILKDSFDRYLITPKKEYLLNPGVYTFEFNYILDRKLWHYKDFNEFYWDVTGSFWNLVVSKSVATVRLPINTESMGQIALVGTPPNLNSKGTITAKDKISKALGFSNKYPLSAGEGLHLLVSIPKKGFVDPDFNKKFEWFIEDYGDIIFSLAGFLAILLAYIASWKSIKENKGDNKVILQKSPTVLRVLTKGIFDNTSFVSFLLDIYRKNIIDIKEENEQIVLVKKTNNLSKLSKKEQKAIAEIFKADTSITLYPNSIIRLKKAYRHIEQDTNNRLKMLSFKLNSGYIFFSAGMLILSELAMSYISINSWHVLAMLLSSTITAAFYIGIFMLKIERKWLNISTKILAVIMTILAATMLSINIHAISTVFILGMIYLIFVYSKMFSTRNGLIKNTIDEAQNFARYLHYNHDKITLGYDFKNQQANIYALEKQAVYPLEATTQGVYKLDLADKICQIMS